MDLKRMYITKRIKDMFPRLDTTNIDKHLDEIKPVLDAIDNQNIEISFYIHKSTWRILSISSNIYQRFNPQTLSLAALDIADTITFTFENLISIIYSCINSNNLTFYIKQINYYYKPRYLCCKVMINQTIKLTKLETLEEFSKRVLYETLKYRIVILLKDNLTQSQRNKIRKIVNSIIQGYNQSNKGGE